MTSLPTSPSYMNNANPPIYQLSSNMGAMSLSGNGNGIQSSTGSVSSSKSHSPPGSLTSTIAGKHQISGSEGSDSEKPKVSCRVHILIWVICFLNNIKKFVKTCLDCF